eukprot:7386892-Prymnesium_polylepis.1
MRRASSDGMEPLREFIWTSSPCKGGRPVGMVPIKLLPLSSSSFKEARPARSGIVPLSELKRTFSAISLVRLLSSVGIVPLSLF